MSILWFNDISCCINFLYFAPLSLSCLWLQKFFPTVVCYWSSHWVKLLVSKFLLLLFNDFYLVSQFLIQVICWAPISLNSLCFFYVSLNFFRSLIWVLQAFYNFLLRLMSRLVLMDDKYWHLWILLKYIWECGSVFSRLISFPVLRSPVLRCLFHISQPYFFFFFLAV